MSGDSEFKQYNKGCHFYSEGEWDSAIACLDEAIRLAPNFSNAYWLRGKCRNTDEEMIPDFCIAIELDPDVAGYYKERADAHYNCSDYKAAIRDYSEVIRLRPGHSEGFSRRAATYKEMGNFELAIKDYDEVLKSVPDDVWSYYYRADCYCEQGEFDKAQADYKQTIDLLTTQYKEHMVAPLGALASICEKAGGSMDEVLHALEKVRGMMDKSIPALSIRQPHAEGIMRGTKEYEMRSRRTGKTGRIYIYASLGRDSATDEDESMEDYDIDDIACDDLPRGVVIGTVELGDCSEAEDGYYYWELSNPVRWIFPIPPQGKPQPTWFYPFC